MKPRGRRHRVPHYPASAADHPTVAILGRPNVGKSTIFNRLAGRPASIVMDQPGVTRDRLYAEADILDRTVTVVDTGGWEFSPQTETEKGINAQCRVAIKEACVVLFVVDGREPLTTGDLETAAFLRRSGVPAILVVNKIDGAKQESGASDVYALGMEPAVMVSAAHGRGFDELEHLVYRYLPPLPEGDSPNADDDTDDTDPEAEAEE